MDMTRNSKKSWNTLKQLNRDAKVIRQHSNVTENQVAHVLLRNGKPEIKMKKIQTSRDKENETSLIQAEFSKDELIYAIQQMKEGKAPGINEIQMEIIKHFRNNTQEWILKFFNECRKTAKIPKQWLKAKVIALLKPEKSPNEPKNFRPISLLCHM